MSGKEILSVLASACAVIAFIAGTAASTLYAGVVLAGFFLGGGLLAALTDSIKEKHNNEYVTAEALRDLSLNELFAATGFAIGLILGTFWDYLSRGQAWNDGFGFAQLAGVAFILGGGWVVLQEWIWHQNSLYKKCPDCARKVLAEARKCEHCEYRFDAVGAP